MAIMDVKRKEEETPKRVVVKEKEETAKIPHDFSEITLSSCNKLSAPYKIHIRDYLNEDALRMAKSKKDVLKSILEFLKDGIYEDVDPFMLHEKELEEIMINIYTAFWDYKIRGYHYPMLLTDDELIEELDKYNDMEKKKFDALKSEDSKEEYEYKNLNEIPLAALEVEIDLSKLKSKPLAEKFKEPIICSDNKGNEVSVRLPRVGDVYKVIDYIDSKTAEKDQIFKDEDNTKEGSPRYNEYLEYQEERELLLSLGLPASCLLSYNGKELSSLEEKIEVLRKIKQGFWNYIWSIIEEYTDNFGIDSTVEVQSPLTKEVVKRRCHFRPMDFIPSGGVPNDAGYDCRFGN